MLAKVLMAFGRRPATPEPRGRVWVVPETGWRTLLDPDSMAGFASICPPRPYRKGEAIYRPGDPAESLFILLEGRIKISLPSPAGERVVAVVGPDDFFGESFLTQARERKSEAVCISKRAVVCPVNRDQFLEAARRVPEAALAFASVLAERNQLLEEELRRTTLPAMVRVAGVLLVLARRFGGEPKKGWVTLRLDLTQEEIGSLAGTTRVTTTQILSELRDRGLIKGTRGTYELDIEGLEELVEALEAGA